jgi:hypothetical protein
MNFVQPYFLLGLIAIAIPVVIHLFNFRRFRRIYFSNVTFLKEIKQETQKKSKIKHLLVLISRILAIAMIVIAFAQPYIPTGSKVNNTKRNIVTIYIDNSFSMQAVSPKGTLFDDAVSKAKEIAGSYQPTDLFQLLTNDFEGRHQAFYTREEFLQLLSELEVSASTKKLSEIITRQKDLLSTVSGKEKAAFLLSDFSEVNCDFAEMNPDTSVSIHLIPLSANETNNVFIDSCWFDSPVKQMNQHVELSVLIKNMSDADAEKIPVKLTINGKQRTLASADIAAGSETEVKLPFVISEKGIQNAVVDIIDNPVIFDDKFYFSFTVAEKLKVLDIYGKEEINYVKSLFENDSTIELTSSDVNKLDYSAISASDLVIVNGLKNISSGLEQELVKYAGQGGSIAIFPGTDAEITSYNIFTSALGLPAYKETDTAETKVSDINTGHKIFVDVFEKIPENMDKPVVYKHYPLKGKVLASDENIMKLQNGDPFLLSVESGKGMVYLSSVPLSTEFSNFPKHALFVPVLYNMALFSVPFGNLYYTIGNEISIETKSREVSGDITYHIKSADKDFEIIPEHKNIDLETYIYPHEQIKEAGNYILKLEDTELEGLSFNYDRRESVMKFLDAAKLEEGIKAAVENNPMLKKTDVLDLKDKSISKVIEEINQGIRLWKIFIILALLFLVTEVLLLRFLKG